MEVSWTAEQLQAIEQRGSNILVAAAAGSGKTAVLVERIIRRICDAKNPVPVNRLLVLTFTEAAAAEMKRKIATAMEERLRLEPDNRWLRDQLLMVSSAHISTVHAFCKTMLQNNIHKTDLPVDFTLIDETENAVLRNQALDRVLERYYQRIGKKEAFRDLTTGYGGTKSDDTLRETVKRLYHFSRSLAYPEKWLAYAAEQYRIAEKAGGLTGTDWEKILLARCRELVAEMESGYRRIWKIVEAEVPSDHKYFSYYQELLQNFLQAFEPARMGETSVAVLKACQERFEVPRTPVKTGLEEEVVNRINSIKKHLVTESQTDLRLLLDGTDPERMERILLCGSRVQVLKQLVRQLERLHTAMKREKSVLDFGDLEHEMMGLLSDRRGNPTEVALQLRERFEEILVDEYQDTNDIQDTIFRLLSKEETNIFMVGDLKQSIYRFRNANPNIFAEKYHRYLAGDGGVCIRLFKNFRSRKTVVDSVNGIFSNIMMEETGGLDYTPEEYLIPGANYPETGDDFTTELLLTDVAAAKEEQGEEGPDASAPQMEAEVIAKRIRNMVDGGELQVTDGETKEPRPVRLGDITILVRNKSRVPEMEQVLNGYGIPTASEVGQQYLDSLEVLTVLSFLQIIDNPRQDIPLLAVLRSAIFGFSPEELANIRLSAKGDFYTALIASAEQGNSRAAEFLECLEDLRKDAVGHGVGHLIFRILHELHYLALVGAMPSGRVRQRNLNLLYERGEEFEQGSLQGLFHFMEYIESLRSEKADMKAGTDFADAANTVSIMTIHKSKGLEFPVVILCNIDTEFNERDASNGILWHENAGIAMDYVDTRLRVKYPTLAKQLVREQILKDSRAEEMRLYYVAATRAKEKLILSTLIGTKHDGWKKAAPLAGDALPAGLIRRQRSMRDWTLSCLLAHPAAEKLREIADAGALNPSIEFPLSVEYRVPDGEVLALLPEREGERLPEKTDSVLDMTERLSYRYPHGELSGIPVKLSISELKRRNMPDSDYVKGVLQPRDVVLGELTEIGAAERGTITHYVMQHMDFARTDTELEIEEQLEEMVSAGLITKRQKSAVSVKGIFGFFSHPLGQRLKKAERTEREFDFYMEIPAGQFHEALPAEDREEAVLLQGIADCFFYEEDGVVLIDYKTDRVPAEQAEEHISHNSHP
ncbi:MAG: helicase-exonuclease AddAB subunit AddA [Clostridia bacterium]|nr:helicase-exonuclease AddAB subunit AddA [Clostridia bacterium]